MRVGGEQRDSLRSFLAERGIGSAIYYPVPLHQQECFAKRGAPTSLPVAERLARECLSLPIFPELTVDQLKLVADTISEFAVNPLLRLSANSPQNR